jgi:NADH dehydrogenase
MHRVVIVGSGFAGLRAAQGLKHAPVEVTVIDRRNYHLFQPLLYQVATGALSPGEIASPIRNILNGQKNARVIMGDVTDIDPQKKEVILRDGGRVCFDSLVIGTGSTHHYFGHDDWSKIAPGLKTIEDATEIRSRVLFAFEAAERASDPDERRAWLTFVIVGGGPTGVELSGALAEIANDTLRNDFRSMNPRDAQIMLVEGVSRILQTFPEELSEAAERSLHKMGVMTKAGAMVTNVTSEGVTVKYKDREEHIRAKTVLWAAGVRANRLGKVLAEKTGAQTDKAGRVYVEPDCSVKGFPNIYVIGDLQVFTHQTGKPLPGVAQTAMQGGDYVAKTIVRRLRGETVRPFHYWDKGNLAVIGRLSGVADLHKLRISGPIAWFIWLFIHIAYLIGFDNRLLVMTEWAYNYFTHNRGARLITGPARELPASSDCKPEETEKNQQPEHAGVS